MIGQANEQMKELNDQSGRAVRPPRRRASPAKGVIVGHGTPARGASWFNLDIDMEIHVPGRKPYRVNNQYMVPASATLGPGVELPVKVDANDQAKIAIDWAAPRRPPARGEIRPAGDAALRLRRPRRQAAAAPAATRSPSSSGS